MKPTKAQRNGSPGAAARRAAFVFVVCDFVAAAGVADEAMETSYVAAFCANGGIVPAAAVDAAMPDILNPADGYVCSETSFDGYLSEEFGSDANDGFSPEFAKRTMDGCYAAFPDGATVGVLPGRYVPPSNDNTANGDAYHCYLIPSTNSLSFVALEGPARTLIAGEFANDQKFGDGYRHTLAFGHSLQSFRGFTIRGLSSLRKEQDSYSKNVSPVVSCVSLRDCVIEGCDILYGHVWGAVFCCEFSNVVVRSSSFVGIKAGISFNAVDESSFVDCAMYGVSFAMTNVFPANSIARPFGKEFRADRCVFRLEFKDVSPSSKSARFSGCTFNWDQFFGPTDPYVYPKSCEWSRFYSSERVASDRGFDEEWALPECMFTRRLFKFAGWSTNACEALDGDLSTPGTIVHGLSDVDRAVVTYYAIWRPAPVMYISLR